MVDDLEALATKADINRLGRKLDRIADELVKVQDCLKTLSETVATKDHTRLILKAIDSLAGKLEAYAAVRSSRIAPFRLGARGTIRNRDC